jgi:hypothetical protein
MKKASLFFTKQISVRSALLIGIGVAFACSLLLILVWNPLLRELGYTKTTETIPENIRPGANALNPEAAGPTPPSTEQNLSRDIDLNQFYNSVQVGKDMDHLVDVSTAAPSNCSTFQVPTLGAEEICTWINGDKAVLFTILNGKIIAKSKHNF